jgi:ankyrin repeat protein
MNNLLAAALLLAGCCVTEIEAAGVSANRDEKVDPPVFSVFDRPVLRERMGWKAEDFFQAPDVLALCKAVEANDIDEIDRLVKNGADVNSLGKDNVTLLLWAFDGAFGQGIETFERLLQLGADPNIPLKRQFSNTVRGSHEILNVGTSVTLIVCKTPSNQWFDAVFKHDGDSNFVHDEWGSTPLFWVCIGGHELLTEVTTYRIRRLIELGADLNHADSRGLTPAMYACSSQFREVVVILLEAGASADCYDHNGRQLIHYAVSFATQPNVVNENVGITEEAAVQIGVDFAALQRRWQESMVTWKRMLELLEERGFDIKDAIHDVELAREAVRLGEPSYLKIRRKRRLEMGLDQTCLREVK